MRFLINMGETDEHTYGQYFRIESLSDIDMASGRVGRVRFRRVATDELQRYC